LNKTLRRHFSQAKIFVEAFGLNQIQTLFDFLEQLLGGLV